MTLEDVKEGICLCSKLLSKVMPSMKTADKDSSGGSSKDQRKDLEGSSEHELKEWSVIELRSETGDDRRGDKSLESSQEVFEEGTVQGKVSEEEEDAKDENVFELMQKKLEGEAEDHDDEAESEDKYEDTQEELDEWSDFQEAEQANENLRTSEFESESSHDLAAVDGETRMNENSEGQKGKTVDRGAPVETHTQQPFQSSLIQACVKYFQDFFAKFVVERVLKHLNSLCTGRANAREIASKECYTALRASGIISDDMWKEMDQGERAASEKLADNTCETPSLKARRNVVGPTILVSSFRSKQSSRSCAEAFVAACKLLLELSCFPVCAGKDSEQEKVDVHEGMRIEGFV